MISLLVFVVLVVNSFCLNLRQLTETLLQLFDVKEFRSSIPLQINKTNCFYDRIAGIYQLFLIQMDTTSGAKIHHPYWPRDLLIPNYVANDRSMSEILVFLFSICGLFLLVTWLITGSSNRFGIWRRLALCWFAICGFIHCVIEGWFSLYYDVIPGDQSFLSQLCEYIIKLKDKHTFKKCSTKC